MISAKPMAVVAMLALWGVALRQGTVVSALFLALALGGSATSQAPTEFKLTASDAARVDLFGHSVALSGDTALVGAPGNDDAGGDSGSAYVFVRSGRSWIQQAKLTANDATLEDLFGWSVALSGDTALVGAYRVDDAGNDSGSAYVFVRSGATWIQQAKLTASDAAAGDFLGWSVALSGDTALVGALLDDDAGDSSGSAYVFVRSGATWSQQAKLIATDVAAGDFLGWSVALSGDTALIGALLDDDAGDSSGSAYVFVRSGATWSQQAKLTAKDATVGDSFGHSVALSGDTALVGAWLDDDAGFHSGSAYVFLRSGTSWGQQAKLTANDATLEDLFGWSVALSGNTALVGAVYDDDAGFHTGSAYVFVRGGTSWIQQTKLIASDATVEDSLAWSVVLSEKTALVGAPGNDDAGDSSGSAYVSELGLATVSEFGVGCAGTLAVPVLQPAPGSLPKTGGTFDMVLSNLPANNPAFLILGLSNTQWLSMSLPMSLAPSVAPGCSLLVSVDFSTGVINTTGTATRGFPIPVDLSLVGLHIYSQGYVLDLVAFGVAVSNGLDIIIGSR